MNIKTYEIDFLIKEKYEKEGTPYAKARTKQLLEEKKRLLIDEIDVAVESCAENDFEVGVFSLTPEETFYQVKEEFEEQFSWEDDELEEYINDAIGKHFRGWRE